MQAGRPGKSRKPGEFAEIWVPRNEADTCSSFHIPFIFPYGRPGNPTRGASGFTDSLLLITQGQNLVLFMPTESSFSHPLSHRLAFPCSREMSDSRALVWRNWSLVDSLQPPPPRPPTLSPFSGLSRGEFRKLSRGFFFWNSLIEPCQEKIIS